MVFNHISWLAYIEIRATQKKRVQLKYLQVML